MDVTYNQILIVLLQKNIKREQLQEALGISRNTMSRYLNNTRQPSLEMLYQIAFVLDVSVVDLLVPEPIGLKKQLEKTLSRIV
ncbi:repressor LexA [Chitinophaga costaii]|uniref:Repressor LexA n=1 Tax=Chitinophaga costaii TaxID=1335309 RepID=A0A1C4EVZ5_9BACT|nr:helix-turn-helix transcriptional regulator [Chitinophaga costaii]PUZ21617.1 XRE family transcriptional regulator [Chitinophaga costaii]SCC47693.1 repressor LexA [Chitinophaga costaii]